MEKHLHLSKKIKSLLVAMASCLAVHAQTQCDLASTPTITQSGNQLISSPGTDLKWYKNRDFGTVLHSGQTFTPSLAGGYVVVSTPVSGCFKTSAIFNYNCTTVASVSANGMTATVAPSTDIIVYYVWKQYVSGPKGTTGGFQVISGANSSSYTASSTGAYEVDYTLQNGCVFTMGVNIDGIVTGLSNDHLQTQSLAYPNPVKDILNVSGKAEVFTLEGKIVAEGTDKIDLSSLVSGLYMVKLQGRMFKITKE